MNASRIVRVIVMCLMAIAVAFCSRKAAPAADQTGATTPATPPSAAGAPVTSSAPTAKPADVRIVPPVPFEQLIELLPNVDGWMRATPRGEETTISGGSIAHARAVYERDSRQIELEITDSGFNPLVLAPLAMSLVPKYAERFEEGYRKAAPIGGHPGFEEWHQDVKRGEVTVVVAGRFVVTATGTGVDAVDSVRAVVAAVDLSRLGALK